MKQFKYYIVIVLLATLIIPSVALAAWWNPFSWNIWNWFFHTQTPSVEQQTQQNNGNFLDQIKNYAYDVSSEGIYFSKGMFGPKQKDYDPKNVKLVNGSRDYGTYHNVLQSKCEEDVSHSVSIAQNSSGQPLYVVGDLNGDGKDDMAVILSLTYKEENMVCPKGFTATKDYIWNIPMLVVLVNKGGNLQQTDSYINGRPSLPKIFDISNIVINSGIISIDGKNKEEYQVVNGKIVVAGQSFQTPNLPSNLKTYTNSDFGFSFQYPDSLKFTTQDAQPPTLFKMQTGSANSGENVFTVSVNAENLSSCVSPGQSGLATELIINGIPFYKITGGGAAMGTYDTEIQYAAFENGRCYRVGLQYFTHNCSAYLPLETGNTQQVANYNQCLSNSKSAEALSSIPDIIVSTFKFNQNMVQSPTPACNIQADKQSYKLGDVINLTWQSQNATGAFWNQPLETGGTRKNIVPPQGNPLVNGSASTVANIEGNQTINLKVSGLGGIADCSTNINVAHSGATPSITIDSGTINPIGNSAGNADGTISGTATNGALYNDDINIVLFDPNYSGPFDEASIYKFAFNSGGRTEWYSGGASVDLRNDNLPFKNWTAKIYAPTGITSVRVLAYPFYSSSTTSPTQPLINKIISLTSAQ